MNFSFNLDVIEIASSKLDFKYQCSPVHFRHLNLVIITKHKKKLEKNKFTLAQHDVRQYISNSAKFVHFANGNHPIW